jgi:GNAT superfamily N-acetyltransferase
MNIRIVTLKMNAQNQLGWLAVSQDDVTVGHTFMLIEPNQTIKFLDSWVHDKYRRKGIFRKLWEARWKFVQQNFSGWKVYAWCKPMSLPLLIEKEFEQGETCVYVERTI